MDLSAAVLMKLHRCAAAAESQVQGHDLCLIYSADSVLLYVRLVCHSPVLMNQFNNQLMLIISFQGVKMNE